MIRPLMIFVAIGFLVVLARPGDAEAKKQSVECTPEAKFNIARAVDFLNSNVEKLKNPGFSVGKRRLQRRRIQRRIGRKLDRMRYKCSTKRKCAIGGTVNGHNASGVFGFHVTLCYETMAQTPGKDNFCFLVKTMAHEFGHSVGIPQDLKNHDTAHEDRVYQFGYFAQRLCNDAGMNRPLELPSFKSFFSKR